MDNFLEEFKKLKEKVEVLEKRTLSSLKLDSLTTGIIKPSSDSTSAIKITKADGTTNILNIDSNNQRVGIGTTEPMAKLHIKPNLTFSPSQVIFQADYGTNSVFRPYKLLTPSTNDAGAPFTWETNNAHAWSTDGIERMRIDENGNVGIGTTNPVGKLQLNGVMYFHDANGDDNARWGVYGWDNNFEITLRNSDWSYNASVLVVNNQKRVGIYNSSPAYTLDVNGQCHASSFPTSSDKRFKENVKEIDNALEKVKKLRGVYFNWNKFYRETLKVDETKDTEIGIIAQEVKKVIPEVVTTFEREVDGKKEKYYSVEYARLSALLINAIKELSLKVENLEKKIWKD
jgi:hypothetical protein